jgi:hypothetical protein
MRYEVLPDVEPPPDLAYDEDEDAALADDEAVPELDEESAEFVHQMCSRTVLFVEEFCAVDFHPYQREFSYRIVESLILNDAEELTGLLSRQSGKTETLADTLAGCMVLFPKLAMSFEIMKRFARGLWVGVFAPTDDQSETLHGRIVDRLTADRAVEMMLDPEIDDAAIGRGKVIRLKSGSLARRQTANPKAKIEGKSYHIIVVDEAQDADDAVVRKSIHPMLAAYAGTMVKIGTPGYYKGDFYRAIQLNKRRHTRRRQRQNHFEYDWRIVAKYNPAYAKFVAKEKMRLGEDSDEFQMSYNIKWLLERGQLITDDDLDMLLDPSMPLVRSWQRSPCVAGIDPARIKDSTVVTVCWVDWQFPDPFGLCEHRVLDWLELTNVPWEEQYFQILSFLDNYNVAFVGVDATGMGSVVAERLALLLGHRCTVVPLSSDLATQSKRWKRLQTLLERRMLVFPGHSRARRTKVWRRWRQQMADAVKIFKQGQLLVEAPNEAEAHDDFVDSLALAIAVSELEEEDTVEVMESPFYRDAIEARHAGRG